MYKGIFSNAMKNNNAGVAKNYMDRRNVINGFWMSLITSIFEIWMILRITQKMQSPSYRPNNWITGHLAAYLILLIVSLIYIVISYLTLCQEKNNKSDNSSALSPNRFSHKTYVTITEMYAIICCFFGLYISVTDYHQTYITYLTMYVTVFTLLLLHPLFSFTLLLTTNIPYFYFLITIQDLSRSVVINLYILQIVLFVVSILNYFHAIAYSNNLSETEKLNSNYKKLANTDALTGLRNRRALDHDISDFINKEIFVAMLDIDDFKYYNDTYGHALGDRILHLMGHIIQENVFSPYCYRYGGDEILIIYPDVNETDFIETMNKCKEVFNSIPLGVDSSITYSYGYTKGNFKNESELNELIKKADNLLYENKIH